MDKKINKSEELSVNVNLDTTPVLYTDNVFMTANEDGVVLDVCQKVGNTNQIRIVSRLGMSRTHAKKLAAKLSKILAVTDLRQGIKFKYSAQTPWQRQVHLNKS